MLRLQAVFDVRPGLGGAWHPFWIAADELSACTGQAHWSIFPKQTANSWPVKQVQFGVSGVDRGREDRRCQRSSGVEQRTHKPLVGGSIPPAGTNFPVWFNTTNADHGLTQQPRTKQ